MSIPPREQLLQAIDAMERQSKFYLSASDERRQSNASELIKWLRVLLAKVDNMEKDSGGSHD